MENECEALPGVAYLGVLDNRSTINTKTGYDDDDDLYESLLAPRWHMAKTAPVLYNKSHFTNIHNGSLQ